MAFRIGQNVITITKLEYVDKTIKKGTLGVVKKVLQSKRYSVRFEDDTKNRQAEENQLEKVDASMA